MKTLTEELALKYINGPHKRTEIAPDLVAVKHPVALQLFGEITDEAAAILAEYDGQLDLTGLRGLSDAAAAALSRHRGQLDLRSLASLSDKSAASLASHQGGINLSFVGHISEDGVSELAKLNHPLTIRIAVLTESIAAHLATHRGSRLDISSEMELSDAAARELANHVGELILFGVSRLSDVAAGYLSSHNGRVEFHMLNELSSRAARMLMNSGAWVQGGWARFHPDPVL